MSKLTTGTLFPMTEVELLFLQEMAKLEGTEARNVIRRSLLDRAQSLGMEIPEGLFQDRKQGNRTKGPKQGDQPTVDRQLVA